MHARDAVLDVRGYGALFAPVAPIAHAVRSRKRDRDLVERPGTDPGGEPVGAPRPREVLIGPADTGRRDLDREARRKSGDRKRVVPDRVALGAPRGGPRLDPVAQHRRGDEPVDGIAGHRREQRNDRGGEDVGRAVSHAQQPGGTDRPPL